MSGNRWDANRRLLQSDYNGRGKRPAKRSPVGETGLLRVPLGEQRWGGSHRAPRLPSLRTCEMGHFAAGQSGRFYGASLRSS
jgi:hypothetical protein